MVGPLFIAHSLRPFLVVALLLLVSSVPANAQTTAFTYQGRLQDTGLPANGSFDLQFTLWDEGNSGTPQPQPAPVTVTRTSVVVTGGVFTVLLDFGAPAFSGADRFLEIGVRPAGVGTFAILSPRQQITSTPYAIRSLSAATADTALNATDATQLAGLAASQYALKSDPPAAGSTNYIQNATTLQAASSFSISGNGTAGGILSANAVDATVYYSIGGSRVFSVVGANTFVGPGTGNANNAGENNSFFGSAAGYANLGNNNSFFGTLAGLSNTTGGSNSFFGSGAGQNTSSGGGNSFFGIKSGSANTTGFSNAFFGANSGQNNVTGAGNAFFGIFSGQANTEGFSNAFFGTNAGFANTKGAGNAFVGAFAGEANIEGISNSFFGTNAGSGNSMGANNSFFGARAGANNTTGTGNTFVGVSAGGANIAENNNTLIGANANGAASISNATAIGANALVTQSNTMVLGNSVDVGIGTSAPNAKLDVVGGTGPGVLGSGSTGVIGTGVGADGHGVSGFGSLIGIYGEGATGVYGQQAAGGSFAGYFNGDVHVNGTLSKSAGSFKIDDPLDPANKTLSHSFVESPDMMNIYNGNITTDAEGDATITLPEYFEALNRDFRYQLTVIGQFAQAIVAAEIKGNRFHIKTNRPAVKVSWQVTGVRHDAYADAHRIVVEEVKPAAERGTYLYPVLAQQPVTHITRSVPR